MLAHQRTNESAYYRMPGIVLGLGPAGPRARIQGSGIDVFEVIKTHRRLGYDAVRLAEAYHWFTQEQLRAALAYYKQYPAEIDQRLVAEDSVTPESLRTSLDAAQASRKKSQ